MNDHTDIILRIAEMAAAGGAIPLDDAIGRVASLISRQDKSSDDYERNVWVLLSVGATLWTLQQTKRNR